MKKVYVVNRFSGELESYTVLRTNTAAAQCPTRVIVNDATGYECCCLCDRHKDTPRAAYEEYAGELFDTVESLNTTISDAQQSRIEMLALLEETNKTIESLTNRE